MGNTSSNQGAAAPRREADYERFDCYERREPTARARVAPSSAQGRRVQVRPHQYDVSEEKLNEVVAFTGANREVCRRVIADFKGDAQAASESLLLSGGRE
eukprot:2271702-Prymnesium_polylepis.1